MPCSGSRAILHAATLGTRSPPATGVLRRVVRQRARPPANPTASKRGRVAGTIAGRELHFRRGRSRGARRGRRPNVAFSSGRPSSHASTRRSARSRRSGAGGAGRSRDPDIAGLERRRPRSTDISAPDLLAVRIELSFRTRGSRRRRVATRADLAAALVFASSGAGADAPSAPPRAKRAFRFQRDRRRPAGATLAGTSPGAGAAGTAAQGISTSTPSTCRAVPRVPRFAGPEVRRRAR